MSAQFVISAVAYGAFLANTALAADRIALDPGAYRVTYRLEVPHVEQFAIDIEATVCASARALPKVLSANNPLAYCPAANIRRTGGKLTFDILCPGRANDSARATAIYTLSRGHIEGRIHMVMGGKNMTYVEIQSWRRIGPCDRLARQLPKGQPQVNAR
jgi:hypothetical protein